MSTKMAAHANATESQYCCQSGNSKELAIALVVYYTIIAVTGIAGNSLVINVVRQNRHMKTTTNIMLVNLAAADILSLIGSLPKRYFDLIDSHPSGEEGKWLCKLFTTNNIAGITLAVSVYTLSLLAVERYHALLKPFRTPRIHESNVLYALGSTWVVASVTQIPVFMYTSFNKVSGNCESPWTSKKAAHSMKNAVIAIITLNVFLPMILISVCYAFIITAIRKSTSARTFDPRDLQSKKKIVKLLIAVTIVFYACFLPFGLYMMIIASSYVDGFSPGRKFAFWRGYEAVKCFMYTSSSLNPVLYAFQSSNYRNGFKRSLPCLEYKNRVSDSKQTAGKRLAAEVQIVEAIDLPDP